MSVVSLLGVKNLNNPAPFTASYQFEITFECLEQLQKGECSHVRPYSLENNLTTSQISNGNSPTSDPPLRTFILVSPAQ
jgi:hypothetical protein